MSKSFKFKQFEVKQDQCAMKVGTDGVLLGAWAPIEYNPFSVLDIGSGTGIVALMLAQRSNAEQIDALEIDDLAYEQCTDNFENSPWNDRLFCYHASLEEFADEMDDKYDLIVSNPPFYSEYYKTQNSQRDLARFQDAMPFSHLVKSVSKLLSENGMFSVIIPYNEENNFIDLASKVNLFPNNILRVKGNLFSKFKRSLITFSHCKIKQTSKNISVDELIIETERHQYTSSYINLTNDFYLNM